MKDNLPQKLLTLMDLTSLNETDTSQTIAILCQKAVAQDQHVAAVCVYPAFVKQAAESLVGSGVKIATVANFPYGNDPLDIVIASIQQSIGLGAREIDLVFPYTQYLAREVEPVREFIQKSKEACGPNVLLKVILETGALNDPQVIADASRDVILAGADFLKTSTGKYAIGATLPAATVMIMTIKEMTHELNRSIGFKVAGGIRTIEQASQYIVLANQMMGPDWVVPETFRIGASQLLDEILKLC
ncbi:MAG: deoxyribose-phosphate aldolase [Gammaproteobacteria bacterium]